MPNIETLERVHVTLPRDLMEAVRKAAIEADRPVTAEIARRLRKSFENAKKGQR